MMLPNDVMNDFKEVITQQGYSQSDFDLGYTDKSTAPDFNGLYFVMGEIVITKNLTKKQKTYKTGHGSSWQAEFEIDLRNGIF